jgi:WD40 repeat protein
MPPPRRRRRRLRRTLVALVFGFLVVLVGLTTLSLWQRRVALQESRSSLSRQLADQALDNSADRADLAALLGLEALHAAETPEARSAALTVLQRMDGIRAMLPVSGTRNDAVEDVTYTPDGRLLSVANARIGAWDVAGRRPVGEPLRHADTHRIVSGPGVHVVALDTNGGVKVGKSGREVTLEGPDVSVNSAAISPDGKTLATGGFDRSFALWDLATGRGRLLVPPVDLALEGTAVAFSRDGKTLTTLDSKSIGVWNVTSGNPIRRSPHRFGEFLVEKLSDDGSLAALDTHRDIKGGLRAPSDVLAVWDVSRGDVLSRVSVGAEPVDLAFDSAGRRLAVAATNGTVGIWDVRTGKLLGPGMRVPGGASSVTFGPGDDTITIGGGRGLVTVWDLSGASSLVERIEIPRTGLFDLGSPPEVHTAFAKDGRTVAWSDFTNLAVLKLSGRTGRRWTVQPDPPSVEALAFHPESTVLALVGNELEHSGLRLWRVESGARLSPLGRDLDLASLSFSPDGTAVATGGGAQSGRVRLWDVQSGDELGKPVWRDSAVVWSVAFSPDGRQVASGGFTRIVSVWRVAGEGAGRRLERSDPDIALRQDGNVSSIAFSPDGELLAVSSYNGTVKLWDTGTWEAGPDILFADTGIEGIAFSPDSRTLAVAGQEGEIQVWDVRIGRRLGEPLPEPGGGPTAVAFSPNGRLLLSAGQRGVSLWDARAWRFDRDAVEERLCSAVSRNLDGVEWDDFMAGRDYHRTCERWPAGD